MGPEHISPVDWLIGLLAAEFLVMPLITLAHEMGHAAVALRVSSGAVIVHVGRPGTGFEIHFERLKVSWSPIPARGVQFRGVCVWNGPAASARDWLVVSLAGPLVTALLIPVFVWATVESVGMPVWITTAFGLSALGAFISCLYNLDPRPANDAERAAPYRARRDGPKALAAYRAWRAPDARVATEVATGLEKRDAKRDANCREGSATERNYTHESAP